MRTSVAHKLFSLAKNVAGIMGVELLGGGGVGGPDIIMLGNGYPGIEGEDRAVDGVEVR
jgi:hypothetical protein